MRLRTKVAIGVAGLVLAAIGGGLALLSSDWLREKIRRTAVESASKAVGGRVELDGFRYDWRALTAEVSRFAIHGTEPAGEAPLLETGAIRVKLEIIRLLALQVRPADISIVRPRVHVIVQPDGSTNLPGPKTKAKKSTPETIVDLRIGRFRVEDGEVTVDAPGRPKQAVPLDVKGEGLHALFTFDDPRARYSGELGLRKVLWNGLDIAMSAEALMERNRVELKNVLVRTAKSQIGLPLVSIANLASPSVTASWKIRADGEEVASRVAVLRGLKGAFQGSGTAEFHSTANWTVNGAVEAAGAGWRQVRNARVSGQLLAKPDIIQLTGVRANALGGDFTGGVELRNLDTIAVKGRVSRFRLAQAASSFGTPVPYDALVSGPVEVTGPLARMRTKANLTLEPVRDAMPVKGLVAVTYDMLTQRVDLGHSWVELPHTRAEVSGALGSRLEVHATSTDIADVQPLLGQDAPRVRFGEATFTGVVTGPLLSPHVEGALQASHITVNDLVVDSISGDVTLTESLLRARGVRVSYGAARLRVDGTLALAKWRASDTSALDATATADTVDLPQLLALAGRKDLPVNGTLNGTARVTGSVRDPRIAGDVTVSKGALYEQPFDSVTARVQVESLGVQTVSGVAASGPKRVTFTGRYEHPGLPFPEGLIEFNATSNTMPLKEIQAVRQRQPSILGFGKFHADGTIHVGRDAKKELRADLLTINGDASANGVEIEGRSLGDSRLTALTRGTEVVAHIETNAPNVAIRGDGTMKISGDYLVDANLKITNTTLSALAALALKPEDARRLNVDGNTEADIRVTGPARNPSEMRAEVSIGKLEMRAASDSTRRSQAFVLTNDGAIRATVSKAGIRLDTAKLKAPQTELSVSGSAAFEGDSPINAQVKGQINLQLLEMFDRDLNSSGMLTLEAGVRGTFGAPSITGRATLKNGDAHYARFSNGLSNANGEIVFNGSRATIQSLSAETGGGKVDLSGFAVLSNGVVAFRVDAKAREVRVRFEEGFSSVSNADLTLAGTSQRSLVSGEITVQKVTINPQSDAASLLALSAQPLQTASVQTGLLANMNLDVKLATSPDLVVQTNLTQSLQADANLRLRGTATNPAILGRANITSGELIFFGNKYTITQGAVSFYNPTKIEPIVNFDLQTRARGVEVVLTVAGQVNKLNVSYRSDPPLQFSEIVALLATGRTPTDATLAARDTGATQSLQGLGASTLVGQAIANPVAGRLQRFFGVSRLKIDPRLTGITGSPQARLTIEQQITPDILFTYVTDVSNTSTQLVRVEWAMNRNWSAFLTREENGKVGLDFSFRKRFK